jgi:hypothetical protein
MVSLVERPILEDFNKTPDICPAVKAFEAKGAENLIPLIGPVFAKHGVTDRFCLCLVHRHFDLHSGEVLVETVANDRSKSVAMPWIITGRLEKQT